MNGKRNPATETKGAIKLHLTSFENPVRDLSEIERRQVFSKIAKQNSEEYNAKLLRIQEIIRSINPLDALAHYGYYDLLLLDQLEGNREPPHELLQQHNVEFLQALYLSLPESEISPKPIQPPLLAELSDCLRTIAPAFSLRRIADKPSDVAVLPVELIRMHTQAIRNRGYPDQIFRFLKNIFAPLDADMQKALGVKPSLLIEAVLKLIKKAEDAANERFIRLRPVAAAKSVEEAVRSYYKLLSTDEDAQRMLDLCKERKAGLLETKALLLSHYDLGLWQTYEFSLRDFINAYPETTEEHVIRNVLATWSLEPGDLTNHDKEHFFLNNPVWAKPIIRIGNDRYFWPLLQMFMSFGLEMLEALVDRFPEVKQRYENEIRPRYLEEEAERVFKSSFPTSTILRGSLWNDPLTGKDFENDLLFSLDSFLIVIECKSGAIPPSARRGGQRLETAINDLIKEPAEQSARFADYLLTHRGPHTFQTKRGVVNKCDTTHARHLVRLSLTLDFFGPLTSMARLLTKTGVLQMQVAPAVTMPVVALETVFDFLDGAHQKLHYLSRRSEWESHVDGMADEYDLLAFYLATGFNVGAFEFENDQSIMLYGLSEQLDAYFRSKIVGHPIPKPGLKLTQWWRDVLEQTEKRAFDRWTDVGMFLLSANYEDQRNFVRASNKLKRNVRANWHKKGHENFLIGTTGPAQRRTAISVYAFKDHITREKRDADLRNVFDRAESETGCKAILVIGIDADEKVSPYQFIALVLER